MALSRTAKSILVVILVLLIDQITKIIVKTTMILGDSIHVFDDWFIIHFTENPGMAFGWEFGGEFGKMALSIFRIIAIIAIAWYIRDLSRKKAPAGLIVSLSLILAGALGNIIDSAFYGMIFSDSYGKAAAFMPEEGGYATFLHGKVVDMLYFPIIKGHYPSWFPFWANEQFIFFRPVFNIADSAITVGVFSIILFQRRYFTENPDQKDEENQQKESEKQDLSASEREISEHIDTKNGDKKA